MLSNASVPHHSLAARLSRVVRFLGRPPSPRHARTKKQHFIQTQAEQDALEKKGAALKKKEAELQAREAKLERMLADVAKQRDLIKSADKELKEQEEAFRQQQLAAQVVRVQREGLRADIEMLLRRVFLVLWA